MLKFVKFFRYSNVKKKAMTLAELLIVFTIMGVIAAMALHVARPLDKGLKYSYARIYHSLQTAIYNARTELPAYLAPRTTGCSNGETLCSAVGMDGDWPTTSENFCKMLVEYINFKPCSVKDYGNGAACLTDSRPDKGSSIPLNQATNEFTIANCNDEIINLGTGNNTNFNAAHMDAALNTANPHIVASNGVKLWIGGIYNDEEVCVPATTTTGGLSREGDDDEPSGAEQCSVVRTPSTVYDAATGSGAMNIKFFVVIADLNGSKRPNTTAWRMDRPADIVAFAVTNTNDVVPLGYPEIDRRYLSARVVYNSRMDQSDALGGTSNAMTLYQAKRHAWAQCGVSESSDVFTWCNSSGDTDINNGMRVNEENILGADLYNHYQTNTAEGATEPYVKVPNFSTASPFYLNAAKIRDVDESLLDETYSQTFCGRTERIGEDEIQVVDQNACYPRIFDFY